MKSTTSSPFDDFVERLRARAPAFPIPDQRANFKGITFDQPGCYFPLRDCVVERSAIVGHAFIMSWSGVMMRRVDFSHTRGEAHWTACDFEKVKFRRLHASLSVAECSFTACDFYGSGWDDPVFVHSTFRNLSLKGLVLKGALFYACRFEDVDLGESRWYESKTLEIRGSWKGKLGAESDEVAQRLFSTPGGGEFAPGTLRFEAEHGRLPSSQG
ncbi:MAG: hypothetical protein HYX75_22230 [Acidobacteria bacterium]|nr:hypothetical protein [Acidobacteriota bacterium]